MRSERKAGAKSWIILQAIVKKKKSGFYTEYGRKPRVVYKQKSDEL